MGSAHDHPRMKGDRWGWMTVEKEKQMKDYWGELRIGFQKRVKLEGQER